MPLADKGAVLNDQQEVELTDEKPCCEAESQSLLKSIAEGDAEAFWVLWAAHQKYLYAICSKHMGGDTPTPRTRSAAQ